MSVELMVKIARYYLHVGLGPCGFGWIWDRTNHAYGATLGLAYVCCGKRIPITVADLEAAARNPNNQI